MRPTCRPQVLPGAAGGVAGCATVFTQRNPRGRTAATKQSRTILVTTEGGRWACDDIVACPKGSDPRAAVTRRGVPHDEARLCAADGRQVVVTDGDLDAVPDELRAEVSGTTRHTHGSQPAAANTTMYCSSRWPLTIYDAVLYWPCDLFCWVVQVREKLLDLYNTVASVVPAAAKKR